MTENTDKPSSNGAEPFDFFEWLRNSFFSGVVLVLPVVVTLWVLWSVVSFIDHNVVPLLPPHMQPYAEAVPGAGVMFAVAALTIVGALAGNLIGRFVVAGWERFLANLPLVRSIYGGSKQIVSQIATPDRQSFKQAVLVEFPRPGAWAIGFVTNEDCAEISGERELVGVFLPQAPIPTTGFLAYLPRADLIPLAIGPEEALKRIISMGMVKHDEGKT